MKNNCLQILNVLKDIIAINKRKYNIGIKRKFVRYLIKEIYSKKYNCFLTKKN